jgi:hypothetical protein
MHLPIAQAHARVFEKEEHVMRVFRCFKWLLMKWLFVKWLFVKWLLMKASCPEILAR